MDRSSKSRLHTTRTSPQGSGRLDCFEDILERVPSRLKGKVYTNGVICRLKLKEKNCEHKELFEIRRTPDRDVDKTILTLIMGLERLKDHVSTTSHS